MRLHRFYINTESQSFGEIHKDFIFSSELLHQWKKVFRFLPGDKLILFDNSGFEYEAEIVSLNNKEADVKILNTVDKQKKATKEVWLFSALIKKDNFEWIIQKTTELGVSHIVPILSERSEKKGLNMERAEKIMIEASEQSGRAMLPTIVEPKTFDEVIQSVTQKKYNENMDFVAFDGSGDMTIKDLRVLHSEEGSAKPIGIFVGPEGGWSEKELEAFRSAGVPIYSLGSQILRAETAAVAVTALLLLK